MEVIVIGGGVAGTASAIALRRIGATVTVHEAYANPAGQVGSFLSLASNGLRGLQAIGCLEPVQQAGFPVGLQRLWASSGKLLGEMPRGRLSGDPLPSTTLMRGHLVETLREQAVRAGADVVTGQRLLHAVPVDDGVRAVFADGSSARADLIVGADGLWSTTRSVLDPSAPRPSYAGLYTVSGVTSGTASGVAPGITSGVAGAGGVTAGSPAFNMVFARNGAFAWVPAPDGTIWWAAQVAAPEQPDLAAIGDGEWSDRLAGTYRFERLPRAIIRAATELHRPTLMHTLGEVPVRHDDRIVLIGDAVHPVGAGQGASMAIEDAVVLAQALAAADSPAAALADYDRLRRPRITRMNEAAGRNRATKTTGPVKRRLNDLLMPAVLRRSYEKSTAWLYTHDLGRLPTAPADER